MCQIRSAYSSTLRSLEKTPIFSALVAAMRLPSVERPEASAPVSPQPTAVESPPAPPIVAELRPPPVQSPGPMAPPIPTKRQLLRPVGKHFGVSTHQAPWSRKELDRVSQFLELKEGGELYQSLHDLFDADYPPSPLHTFLAEAHPQATDRTSVRGEAR